MLAAPPFNDRSYIINELLRVRIEMIELDGKAADRLSDNTPNQDDESKLGKLEVQTDEFIPVRYNAGVLDERPMLGDVRQ